MLRTVLLIFGILVAIALFWLAPLAALAAAVVLLSFWVDRRRRARLRDRQL